MVTHFEFLVEDRSGKILLEQLLPKILPIGVTNTIHSYSGIGGLPKNLKPNQDNKKRVLLNNVPRLVAGLRKSLLYSAAAIVLVFDLDKRDHDQFEADILASVGAGRVPLLVCLAIEEMEAWLLGDKIAIMTAYPKAKIAKLNQYHQDAICGTWEALAEVVYIGGAGKLNKNGYPLIGIEKCTWAELIGQHLDPARNLSPSFRYFRDSITDLATPNPFANPA